MAIDWNFGKKFWKFGLSSALDIRVEKFRGKLEKLGSFIFALVYNISHILRQLWKARALYQCLYNTLWH